MGLYAIAAALVACCGMVLFTVERIVRVVLQHQQAIAERRMALDEQVKAAPPKREPLPGDLAGLADLEREPWAREQVRAAIQDEYEALGDWDAVRNSLFGAR